jgi:hypothetical protein
MLDHLDAHIALVQAGASGHIDPVAHLGPDAMRGLEIGPEENQAVVDRSGMELDSHVAPAPVPEPLHTHGVGNGLLLTKGAGQGMPISSWKEKPFAILRTH